MEAAQISGVPFFTVDYWDRSKFLRPSAFLGAGRGRGRQRMYTYGDILRLRIARELRDQQISLETLRRVVDKLGSRAGELEGASYVLVGRTVEFLRDVEELARSVARSRRGVFCILLDLADLSRSVELRARRMVGARTRARSPRAAQTRGSDRTGVPRAT